MFVKAVKIKSNKKKLAVLYRKQHELEEVYSKTGSKDDRNAADRMLKEIDAFIEDEYAYDVFEYYSKKAPCLIKKKDSTASTWESVFGNDATALTKNMKHALVGLIEGGGAYSVE